MSRSELTQMIEDAKLNPMSVQRNGIEYLERVRGGEVEVVDASNAFVYLMEFASTMYANLARRDEFLNLRQYPELAQTRKDLYHHMSDVDYINTFATPATVDMTMVYSLDEVMERAIPTGNGDIRKMVIPRHTQIMAGEVPFTLQYPVEIRVLPHGGIQTVFDNSLPSPLQALESNHVDHWIMNYNVDHTDYLQIEVPVQQLRIKSYTAPMTASKTFRKSYDYTDQYCHCRVYMSTTGGKWTELKTTHSDLVYDPNTPTAALTVLDGNVLEVVIPQVYYSNGTVKGTIRVDVYTTRGAIDLELKGYSSNMFSATYADYDNSDGGKFTSPLMKLTSSQFMATSSTVGGSNAINFDKLKERAIHNALGPVDLPITNVQIQSQLDRLTDAGFSCVTDIDNVTNRLYAASRQMPVPDIEAISTGIGTSVLPLSLTIDQILNQADAMDNGQRITILPTTLYRDEGGYLSVVGKSDRNQLLNANSDVLTAAVNDSNFLYSPFHYVYDTSNNVFKARPYYFGDPAIDRRFFVNDNNTLGAGVNVNSHRFTRTDDGWKVQVMTNSTESLKELDDDALVAQLAFVPPGELSRVYLNGTLVGRDPKTKEWLFEFAFDSTWDVDQDNCVYLKGFEGEGVAPHPYPSALTQVFDMFYGVRQGLLGSGRPSQIDEDMGMFLIPDPVVGLYHEQITLTLGHELSGMWSRARPTIGEEQYLRYMEDVPKLHTSHVPAKNENGSVLLEYDAAGKPSVVYEYRAGDPVVIDGVVQYLHRAGDPVIENGSPVQMEPRRILRQVELVLFEGAYYFVTNPTDTDYRDSAPETIVEWVNHTLKPLREKLLETTKLWFHPKSTVGQINAIVDGALSVSMEASQRLRVEYFVDRTVMRDEVLKEEIRKATREEVARQFGEAQVTRDGLATSLKQLSSGDVVGVRVNNLGGLKDYSVVTMVNESSRLCIGKRLVALPNATLGVEDSIDIIFSRHSV